MLMEGILAVQLLKEGQVVRVFTINVKNLNTNKIINLTD